MSYQEQTPPGKPGKDKIPGLIGNIMRIISVGLEIYRNWRRK